MPDVVRLLLRNAARTCEYLRQSAGSLHSSRSKDWHSAIPSAAPAEELQCRHIPSLAAATAAAFTSQQQQQQKLQGSWNRLGSLGTRAEAQQKDCLLQHRRGLVGAAGTPIPGGKYVMEGELGHGNYGTVYKGRNVVTEETVAIKVLDKKKLLADDGGGFWESQRYNDSISSGGRSSRKRRSSSGGSLSSSGTGSTFITNSDDEVLSTASIGRRHQEEILIREIHAMMSVKHPYIARLLDVTASVGKIFLVMEFVSGGDLHHKLCREWKLDEAEARRLFQQMIDAVHFCHGRGVFHRDLKPENVLISEQGDVKVADFGLAGLRDLDQARTDPRFYTRDIGSPPYMAPEAIDGMEGPGLEGYRGETADIWSSGVMLFQMLAGHTPFEDPDYPCEMVEELLMNIMQGRYKIPPHFSSGARDLVSRILTLDPVTRITAAEIYQHPWFKQDYVAPDFRGIGEVKASLEAVEAVFAFDKSRPVEPQREPRTMSAFELLAQEAAAPVNQTIAPYFRRPAMDYSVKQETMFMVQQKNVPARELLRLVHRAVPKGFQVQFKGAFQMRMFEAAGTMHEPLCVVAEVSQVVPGTYYLVFRRMTGEPRRFQDLCRSFSRNRRFAKTFGEVLPM